MLSRVQGEARAMGTHVQAVARELAGGAREGAESEEEYDPLLLQKELLAQALKEAKLMG